MKRGVLRTAINDLVTDNPIHDWLADWYKRFQARRVEVQLIWDQGTRKFVLINPGMLIVQALMAVIYELSGAQWAKRSMLNTIGGDVDGDVSSQLAAQIKEVFKSPEIRELAEITGTLITDPILDIFEQYAGDDTTDPKEFARAFHGFMGGLTGGAGIASTLIEAATGGQVEGAGTMLTQMYWSLGLGFLGWQTLAPVLSFGLQPGLERYYKHLYRPSRFTLSQLMDLYALGEITVEELTEGARFEGWRDKDISKSIKLAFRQLTAGEVLSLWQEGHIDDAEAVTRLRALGYDPDDIPQLFKLNPKDDTKEAKAVSLTTAKQAFKERLITEEQFRAFLAELNYSDTEIELQVQLASTQTSQEERILTAGQIRQAWEENVLTDTEALHWLSENGYGPNEAQILLATWKAGSAPPFRLLNMGTIVAAYTNGVINREAAKQKLVSVGFNEEDALLQLDLAEARNPEAFGKPVPATAKKLTPSTLQALLEARLIDGEGMKAKLIETGFSETDADLLTELALQQAGKQRRPLTPAVIEEAYLSKVITRTTAQERLLALDFDEADAVLLLDTLEASNPAAFNPESVTALRQPSVGAITEALFAKIITEDEFYRRMAELGYERAGADIYKSLATVQAPVQSKKLSAAEIDDAYRKGFIPFGEAIQRYVELGYSNNEALLKLRLTSNVISDMEPFKNMLAGLITPEQAFDQLLSLGFTPDEINAALATTGG